MRTLQFFLIFTYSAISALNANTLNGEELYTTYCSACHGLDGKGANDGAFPPLSGSKWLEGTAKRSVAIVVKGLRGPVEVSGKTYDLEMPPQGEVLNDDQIVAIINYVNAAWGNKGEKVQRDLVRVVRAEYESRKEAWTAEELIELFPFPKTESAFTNLISRVYKGQWDHLPNFDKIQAENVEEEHDGLIDISVAALDSHFGIVWEGGFSAPEAGEYEFSLDADDGARLILNGKPVCVINNLGPMNGTREVKGSVTLKEGSNPARVEYFQGGGSKGIQLRWKKADGSKWHWLSDHSTDATTGLPSIPLTPSYGQTIIYRNFIEGTTARAIAFGFPGGTNLAYSADHLAPEILWIGNFMNAGRHWTNRGQGKQAPSGTDIFNLTDKRFFAETARFKGYSLDTHGNPTFKIQIDTQMLSDSWKPGEGKTLIRTLTITGGKSHLDIPLGNSEITGAEQITLTPDKPSTVIYKLK